MTIYNHYDILADIKNAVIITDDNVKKHYAERFNYPVISFPAGEANKTRETKCYLEDQLLSNGFGRDMTIIALGGGVVTDMAGFVAATYCRGVPAIYIPTSLLAMVDAAIGGKTGVNTPQGKNLVGSFTLPQAVIIDPTYLQTLPDPEYRSAFAEIIKHALIADKHYFANLMELAPQLNVRNLAALEAVIHQSIAIKTAFVEKDFQELSQRAVLNFGHTIGHAIEADSQYQIKHGDAVAMGIWAESVLSHRYASLSQAALDKIAAILHRFGLPLSHAVNAPEKFFGLDKKAKSGKSYCVLLEEIGRATVRRVERAWLEEGIECIS